MSHYISNPKYLLSDDDMCLFAHILEKQFEAQVGAGSLAIQIHALATIEVALNDKEFGRFLNPMSREAHGINFHYIPGHWMMSYQCPCSKSIRVYDSMVSKKHFTIVKKQLAFFYETDHFELIYCQNVSQQATSFPCGVYAAAFATLCAHHELPENVQLADEANLRYIFYGD